MTELRVILNGGGTDSLTTWSHTDSPKTVTKVEIPNTNVHRRRDCILYVYDICEGVGSIMWFGEGASSGQEPVANHTVMSLSFPGRHGELFNYIHYELLEKDSAPRN